MHRDIELSDEEADHGGEGVSRFADPPARFLRILRMPTAEESGLSLDRGNGMSGERPSRSCDRYGLLA